VIWLEFGLCYLAGVLSCVLVALTVGPWVVRRKLGPQGLAAPVPGAIPMKR
jgi:predicted RND superfamily exporter protein